MFGSMAAIIVTHLDDINRGPQPVISSVTSIEGEELTLVHPVPMEGAVESWLEGVVLGVQQTLMEYTTSAIHSYADTTLEEFVQKVRHIIRMYIRSWQVVHLVPTHMYLCMIAFCNTYS